MQIMGFNITRSKNLTQPDSRGSWRTIYESYAGAWQQNVEVKVDLVLAHSTVYTCITRISSDVSKLRLRLVRDVDGVWQEAQSPVFSPILRRPNSYQNRMQFFQQWVLSKLTHGNAYVLKERDGRGVVRALYVLDPRLVRVLISDDGEVFYEIRRDNLAGVDSEIILVPAREIIHDRMNAIFHPLVGISPLYAGGLAATQGLEIQMNSARFFKNGARPGGVLTAPGEIKTETAARLKAHWEANYSGDNAGKVAVLGDGLKYEAMMMKSSDAQLIEQLKWTSQTVANVFQVPPFMVGAAEVPPNNNVEALTTLYYSSCLQTHIEAIELALDDGLELPNGYGTEFNLDDLMRMDTATLVRSISEAIGSGAMAPNEGRKRLSLPPVAGGDTPYLQQQNYSLAALDERDKASPLVVRDVTPEPQDTQPVEEAVERAMQPYLEAVRKSGDAPNSDALAARFEVLLNA
jgi:HK97 family phage portal protein